MQLLSHNEKLLVIYRIYKVFGYEILYIQSSMNHFHFVATNEFLYMCGNWQ